VPPDGQRYGGEGERDEHAGCAVHVGAEESTFGEQPGRYGRRPSSSPLRIPARESIMATSPRPVKANAADRRRSSRSGRKVSGGGGATAPRRRSASRPAARRPGRPRRSRPAPPAAGRGPGAAVWRLLVASCGVFRSPQAILFSAGNRPAPPQRPRRPHRHAPARSAACSAAARSWADETSAGIVDQPSGHTMPPMVRVMTGPKAVRLGQLRRRREAVTDERGEMRIAAEGHRVAALLVPPAQDERV
jgi:hypothetical protein